MPVSSTILTNERISNDDLISKIRSDDELQSTKVQPSKSNNTYPQGNAIALKSTVISEAVKQPVKDKSNKRKSLLNTYSSEELLHQAASSLQGLEGTKIRY